MLYSVLVTVQVLIALGLIGLILLQHGKGADAGAAFGSGASGTVFGAKGSANFMSRATAVLAVVFFAVSLCLAYLVSAEGTGGESVTSGLSVQTSSPAPQPASDAKRKQASDMAAKASGDMNADKTGAAPTNSESAGSPTQGSGKIAPLPGEVTGNSSHVDGGNAAGSESNTESGNSP